ncbi:hypothetical protein [Chitinophaga sp. 212800010-3]|uniref:hypothetical protein n=1 Tax=unclassified Chitinophaga TaxID=2619133 RepID=UPI002DEACEE1|nr:hypothetical protein [Chitinophaga sp. 212800010-3]
MKKTNFIWISGAINSGKSTVAGALSKVLPAAVNIELDALASFEQSLDIDQKLEFIIQDALDLARNWISRNFIPVLNWPLYGKEVIYMLEYAEKLGLQPILINLTPPYDVVAGNRNERILEEWELQRIRYMYDVCRMHEPVYGHRIDNSGLTVAETVERIVALLN